MISPTILLTTNLQFQTNLDLTPLARRVYTRSRLFSPEHIVGEIIVTWG